MLNDLPAQAKSLFNIDINASQLAAFERYTEILLDWNQRINLTSITDPDDVRVKHFLDSLSLLILPHLPEKAQVIDVGTGAGLPGLVLQIMRPEWEVTLLDATGKKVKFMQQVIEQLDLQNTTAVQIRAENAGQDRKHRERYDLVIARAVARLPVLVEYLLPLCLPGGLCVAMKGDTAQQEVQDANYALQMLGGWFEGLTPIELPGIEQMHYLVSIRKIEKTPPDYPRRPGIPSKSPLMPG